jgi:hypothetical protein
LDATQNAFWLHERKRSRTSILIESVKKLVVYCWTSETTIFPNRMDILVKRTCVNEYIKHQMQVLQVHFL